MPFVLGLRSGATRSSNEQQSTRASSVASSRSQRLALGQRTSSPSSTASRFGVRSRLATSTPRLLRHSTGRGEPGFPQRGTTCSPRRMGTYPAPFGCEAGSRRPASPSTRILSRESLTCSTTSPTRGGGLISCPIRRESDRRAGVPQRATEPRRPTLSETMGQSESGNAPGRPAPTGAPCPRPPASPDPLRSPRSAGA
jgi:hypothetical protein